MIKSYLKRIFLTISWLFCAISMVSAYSFRINGITYEAKSNGLDLKKAKNELLMARVIDISDDLLDDAVQNNDNILEIPFSINYGNLEYIVTLSGSAVQKAEKLGVSITLTPVDQNFEVEE